ncbi:MAG: hypothetical protein ABSA78_10120 [Candidatus Sulfotelmatobacter sp.]
MKSQQPLRDKPIALFIPNPSVTLVLFCFPEDMMSHDRGDSVADDQVIKLLEEIRELQREHLTHYKLALQNQREALAMQRPMVQRSKLALVAVGVLFLFVCASYFVPLLSWSLSLTLYR